MDKLDLPAPHFDLSVWNMLAIIDLQLAGSSAYSNYTDSTILRPDDGMNKGRAMRQLFMSLIC